MMMGLIIAIGVVIGLSLIGTIIAAALGLFGVLLGVALPVVLAGGFGYFVYYMFKRGFNSAKDKRTPAEPLEETKTEVVDDDFQSYYQQKR